MKIVLLNTNGTYSHLIQYLGIKDALEQLKQENVLDFIVVNISEQDGPKINEFNPDWILAISPLAAGLRVHKKYRNRKVICYDTESIYENLGKDTIPYCDVLANVDKFGTEWYKNYVKQNKIDCKIYHMPLGFDPSVYKFQNVEESYKSDICIAGVLFDRRRKILEYLYPLRDKIKLRLITAKDWYRRVIHPDAITYFHKDVVSPEELVKYYVGAKIILCVNRDYSPSNKLGEQSSTPGRVFQETACRRLVMVDNSRPEVFDYFEDKKEIVTFDPENADDLREKILYYLEHEQEREAIAHNGYIRTMKENTWKSRIQGLLNFIQ
jgi:spore maturation protein CgeB